MASGSTNQNELPPFGSKGENARAMNVLHSRHVQKWPHAIKTSEGGDAGLDDISYDVRMYLDGATASSVRRWRRRQPPWG